MKPQTPPIGLKWRAGVWYVTFVIWVGITVDLLVYSIVVPVLPFQLQNLGYDNPSSLTGWLMCAFYAGSVIGTFPIAMISERYGSRQWPLIVGILIFMASLTMLMLAPWYWLMVIARILQGVAAAMTFIPGLSLLCDSVPQRNLGRHLGLAFSGLSAGILVGPPVGGILFRLYGFRGPCIFGIIACFVDLVTRLIVIERKSALGWGFDPKGLQTESITEPTGDRSLSSMGDASRESLAPKRQLTLVGVVASLVKSPRACATVVCVFMSAVLNTAPEPPVPMHGNQVWGADSSQIGVLFIAAVIPGMISTPLSGILTDKYGPPLIVFTGLMLSIPFWVGLTSTSLPVFVTMYALIIFFTSGSYAPLNKELAEVARKQEGIGFAHVYGAFNIAYGMGGAVGPLLGGQVFDRVPNGWSALCYISVGLVFFTAIVSYFGVGEETLSVKVAKVFANARSRKTPHPDASFLDMGSGMTKLKRSQNRTSTSSSISSRTVTQ